MKTILLISLIFLLFSCNTKYVKKNKNRPATSLFQLLDIDKNNALTVKEFSNYFLISSNNRRKINNLLAQCDSRPVDQKITKQEAINCGAKESEFEEADLDRNRTVDPVEFFWIITNIRFREVDKNKDLNISIKEFNQSKFWRL